MMSTWAINSSAHEPRFQSVLAGAWQALAWLELILTSQEGVLKPHDPSAAHLSDPFPLSTPRTMTLRRNCCSDIAFFP